MYSVIVDGNVLDFKYKRGFEFSYAFYIGDILIGQVFNMGRHWSGVSWEPHPLGAVSGFKTRHDAAEFLLKLNGYR